MPNVALPVIDGTSKWSTQATTGFTSLTALKTLIIPTVSPNVFDVTTLGSTWAEKYHGIFSMDDFEVEALYSEALFSSCLTYALARTYIYFKTEIARDSAQTTTGDTFDFGGYIFPSIPTPDITAGMMMTIKITPSGEMTWSGGV